MAGPAEYRQESVWAIAFSRGVVRRALRVAGLVGLVLAFINHGDRLLRLSFEFDTIWRVLLTFCVPYCVSTYSSVLAVREFQSSQNQK